VSRPENSDAGIAPRLAARTAHDLNNVLAIFSGHLYLLRESAEPPGEAYAAMEQAIETLQRLSRSLAELGALAVEPREPMNLNDVVRAAAERFPGGAIDLDLDPTLPTLHARRADVQRAIEALLNNAREASKPGSRVRASTAKESDGRCRVTVEDDGTGVSPDVRRRDFDPLVSTRREKGRGIGITIARAVAALEGGSFEIEDRPEGGTRAHLRLSAGDATDPRPNQL
jgi:signal transduction histidine kinase